METNSRTGIIGRGRQGLTALLVAQFMGAANDNILKALLSFAVVAGGMWSEKLGQGGQGLIALCLCVPFILFSGWAGPLADRHSKRTIAIWMKWIELPLAIVAGLGFVIGNFWLTTMAMVLLATQSTFFSPAKYGMIPELVPDSAISRANGVLNMTTNIAVIAGMLVAGIVSDSIHHVVNVDEAIATEVVSQAHIKLWLPSMVLIGVAVIGISAIVWLPKLVPLQPSAKIPLNPFSSYGTTVREMWGTPLWTGAIAWALFYLLATTVILVITEFGDVLNVDDQRISYLLAAVGVSVGIGSLTAGFLSKLRIRLELSRRGAIAMVIALFIAGVAPVSYWVMLTCLVWLGLSAGFYAIPLQSLMQTLPVPGHRGRVLATSNAISFAFMAGGSLVYWGCRPLFGDSPQIIFVICSGIAIVAWFNCKRIPENLEHQHSAVT